MNTWNACLQDVEVLFYSIIILRVGGLYQYEIL